MSTLSQVHSGLNIRLFGAFSLQWEGRPLPALRTRKGQWLLALLVLRQGRAVERDWLAATLWPDSPEETALANLRRMLTDLRQALGTEAERILAPTSRTLCLDLEGAHADVAAFDAAIKQGDRAALEEAIALYSGVLLEGCEEPWIFQERVVYEQAYLTALETLAGLRMADGDPAGAQNLLRQAIVADPLRETAQRALMSALAQSGNYAAAILTYREFRVLLRRELNTEPDPETVALYRRIRTDAGQRAQLPAAPTPPPAPTTVSTPRRLPRPLSPLIGRAEEIRALEACVENVPLVTLLGPGGIGKTRLAIQVAEELLEDFPAGAWFVDLSPLTDPALLPLFVASGLEVRESGDLNPIDALIDHLRPQHLLLVLDNCEHLIAACAELCETLFTGCPYLKILATSREPLNIAGEQPWRVPPLSLPDAQALAHSEKENGAVLLEYDAIRLFMERAHLHRPDFTLTPRNSQAVARICRRLDGIPLALELAAARLRVLPADQIAERLDNRFALLTGGSRTAWPRHQTLRAAVDWSYDLLSDEERTLLRRLSVFAGGWSLETAEEICTDRAQEAPSPEASDAAPLPPDDLLDVFTSLLDKSLIQPEAEVEGARRYRLLETIRQYAEERLREAGEWETFHRRHRDGLLHLAQAAYTRFYSGDQENWLKRLDAEYDNLRAALDWSLHTAGEEATALALISALISFWFARCHYREGLQWCEQALTRTSEADVDARMKVVNGAGAFCWALGEYTAAQRHYEAMLQIQRARNDTRGIAYALQNLGLVHSHRGEYVQAVPLMEESIALMRQIEETGQLATALHNLAIVAKDRGQHDYAHQLLDESYAIQRARGNVHGMAASLITKANLSNRQGDYALAVTQLEEALEMYRATKDRHGISVTLNTLGETAQFQQDYAHAGVYYQESLAISYELGLKHDIAAALCNLGQLAQEQGNTALARTHFRESIEGAQVMRDRATLLSVVTGLAEVARTEGDSARAVRLYGVVVATRAQIGVTAPPRFKARMDKALAELEATLGSKAFAAAWAEGSALTLEQAVPLALQPSTS